MIAVVQLVFLQEHILPEISNLGSDYQKRNLNSLDKLSGDKYCSHRSAYCWSKYFYFGHLLQARQP